MNLVSDVSLSPLFSGDYMPHGMCYAWEPSILWLSIFSDLLIASSYFSIPVAILIFTKKRQIKNYRHIYILFAIFIFFCGLTHLFTIFTIFNGFYGYQAILKFATGVVSFLTAVAFFKYLPLSLTLPSPAELITEQKAKAENEIFKQISLNSPIGLILVNEQFNIEHMNPKACQLFGYAEVDILGLPVNNLISGIGKDIHITLMQQYTNNHSDTYEMNSGRRVGAIKGNGDLISVEITISTGHYQDKNYIFVSVIDREDSVKADNLLRKSLIKLDRITEATEDGFWEWNILTNEMWQSKKHLVLMGYDENSTSGYDIWVNHIHPDEQQRVIGEMQSCIATQKEFLTEYLGKTKAGKFEWFRVKGKLTLNEDREPVLLSGNFVNIHKDIMKKSDLIDKSNYLEKVIDRSINCLYIYDFINQEDTYVNDEYTYITGYSLDDLNQLKSLGIFMDLFHPEEIDGVMLHIQRVEESKEGEVYSHQYRFKHKQGHWLWCISKDSIFSFDDNGKPKEMLGTFIDITVLKESEETQKKLFVDFQSTFEMAAVGVAHIGLDGTLIKVNKKVCEILGYTKEQLLATSFQKITYHEDLDLDLLHVAALIGGDEDSYQMEKRYVRGNGHVFWANLTVSIVRSDDGAPDYFISVIEDITHRKSIELDQIRLNKELKESNDQLTRFAYSASHDMQEPLRKITSFSTSLLSRLGDSGLDEKSKFELQRISTASRRMKNMIQRLLDLSRTAAIKLILAEVTTEDLINDAKEQLSVICEETNTIITANGFDTIVCDRLVMSNVIENLIRNSIKYKSIDRVPVINISVEETKNHSIISFKDNGMGFNNKFKQEIFDPFKRLVNHNEVDGSGMGLTICKQLISLHGGEIMAVGVEGKGANFIIKLPRIKINQ
ncbi:MAG: PAS domain S-box-containing protein [Psychrobacter glaciei]|jgi:PAS domain S-box-containing protein